jgi:aspartokinase-like uncharacterized kinase
LLTLDDLTSRLRDVLAQRPGEQPLLVVGGGAAADVVRDWGRIHHLGDERSHWLALEAMRLNEALLLELLPRSRAVANRAEAGEAWNARQIPILRAAEFVRAEESEHGPNLPHNWDVTSDSVAAWVTLRWPADGLVLLKSVGPPSGGIGVASTCAAGRAKTVAVDAYFRHLAGKIQSVAWVNVRDEQLQRVALGVGQAT